MAKMQLANGTRVTKGTFPTTAIPAADLPKVVSQDIYETVRNSFQDDVPEGSRKQVLIKAGTILTQRQIDALFDEAKIVKVTPASGPIAGGTAITIEGEHLDGVTAVSLGVAVTSFVVVSDRKITCVAAATTAGAKTVSITAPSGTVTKANGYTYV
jgi:hypothetical protein